MINRLLRRDIDRRTSIPRELTDGSRSGFSGRIDFDGNKLYDVTLAENGVFEVEYDGQSSLDHTWLYHIDLNLETVPLIVTWYLGAWEKEKGSPASLDTAATILTASEKAISGYQTYASVGWGKSSYGLYIRHVGTGTPGASTNRAFFRIAIYYDDTYVQRVGL